MNVKNALILLLIVIIACIWICSDTRPMAYEQYVVNPGDTVYSISVENTSSNIDYRMTEHYILKVNDIKNACVFPGDTIFIPVWE